MTRNLIFLPVLIQTLLTLALYISLSKAKNKAVRLGEVDDARRSLYADAWPEYVMKINNSIRNQFEVPVLFYVLVFILWNLNAVSIYIQLLSWLFVLTRIAHAFIHTGSNFVPYRRKLFTVGVFAVIIMSFFAFWNILSEVF